MKSEAVLIWCLLAALMPKVFSYAPEMSIFGFGGCPNVTASDDQDIAQATGRWYVLRTTSAVPPAGCVRVDVQETSTSSNLYEVLYRYMRGATNRVEAQYVQLLDTGELVAQRSGVLGMFGQRQLVLDQSESGELAAVIICQPIMFGHMISAQLWSRNAAIRDEGEELTSTVQILTGRGVPDRFLRQVNQTACPVFPTP